MGSIRKALVRPKALLCKEDHMNRRTVQKTWWHGRVARRLGLSAVLAALLISTVRVGPGGPLVALRTPRNDLCDHRPRVAVIEGGTALQARRTPRNRRADGTDSGYWLRPHWGASRKEEAMNTLSANKRLRTRGSMIRKQEARQEDLMNMRTLRRTWWHGRVGQVLALLAAASAALLPAAKPVVAQREGEQSTPRARSHRLAQGDDHQGAV